MKRILIFAIFGLFIFYENAYSMTLSNLIASMAAKLDSVHDYQSINRYYNRIGKSSDLRTYKYWYVAPGYIRMKIIKGKSEGSVVFYNPKTNKVRAHKGGLFSFIKLTLKKDDKRVVSIRGVRIDQTSFSYVENLIIKLVNSGLCSSSELSNSYLIVCSYKKPLTSDIYYDKLTLSKKSLLPTKWERDDKDGKPLYEADYKLTKINSGLSFKDITF